MQNMAIISVAIICSIICPGVSGMRVEEKNGQPGLLVESVKPKKILIEGLDVFCIDKDMTKEDFADTFMDSISKGYVKVTKELLDLHNDAWQPDFIAALKCALEKGHTEIFSLLLKSMPPSGNVCSRLLKRAWQPGREDIAKLLLEQSDSEIEDVAFYLKKMGSLEKIEKKVAEHNLRLLTPKFSTLSPQSQYDFLYFAVSTGLDDRCPSVLKNLSDEVRIQVLNCVPKAIQDAKLETSKRRNEIAINKKIVELLGSSPLITCRNVRELAKEAPRSFSFSQEGKILAYPDSGGVKLWNISTGKCIRKWEAYSVSSVRYGPDGRMVALGTVDKTVVLLDASTDTCICTLEGHTGQVTSVSYSQDGKLLASGSKDKTVRIWDVTMGKCIHLLENIPSRLVSYSPDGKTLAVASGNKVTLWDISSGKCALTLIGHKDKIADVVFSPNGRTLASGSKDKTVRVWDASTGACIHVLEGHRTEVVSLSFCPDCRTLASGGKTVRLWDTTTGACIKEIDQSYKYDFNLVCFSPDGRTLALSSLKSPKLIHREGEGPGAGSDYSGGSYALTLLS